MLTLLRSRLQLANGILFSMKIAISILALTTISFLTSCAVGPNYNGAPKINTAQAFKEQSHWKKSSPQDLAPRGKWWMAYNDAMLDKLVERVQLNNQNIKQFAARYRAAQASGDAARAAFFPSLGVSASANRGQSNTSAIDGAGNAVKQSIIKNNYGSSLGASWELDIWGKLRREVEAQNADTQASAANLAGALLSAQALLVQNYFQLRMLDEQKALYKQTVIEYQKSRTLTQNQYNAGIITRANLAQAQTQLYSAQTALTDLGVARAQLEHSIANLIGVAPANFSLPVTPFTATLPAVPAVLPSELLERRPDIASAERAVKAANAKVGIATAALYPTLTLSASGGYQGNQFANLFDLPSRVWSLGAGLSQPIFEGGLLRANKRVAEANYDAVVATYRQTVLNSLKEVEDNLAALRILQSEAQTQQLALIAAQDSARLALNQYKAGTTTYVNVAVTQAALLAAQRDSLNIQQRRFSASVLLIKALGGGWNAKSINF